MQSWRRDAAVHYLYSRAIAVPTQERLKGAAWADGCRQG